MQPIQFQYKTAVLLINTGSPESPGIFHVARYLSKFLGDKRVLDLPCLFRKLLVDGIIVPFRCKKSSGRYRDLWNLFGGSFPLLHYGIRTRQLLQDELGTGKSVFLGMRYGSPSIEESIDAIYKSNFDRLIIIPMFPHYASSSVGSALGKVMKELGKKNYIPSIRIIHTFYEHPLFIDAVSEQVSSCLPDTYEKILCVYHSLPLSHIRKESPYCDYESSCRTTSNLIAGKLNLNKDKVHVAFQSRMSHNWLGPSADEIIIKMAKEGVQSVLVVAPSFVADCLETVQELGVELKRIFLDNGGKKCHLAASLNDSPKWIGLLKELVETTA